MRAWPGIASCLMFLCAVLGSQAWCQQLTLGVPEFPRDINVLTSAEPAAFLMRAGVVGTLFNTDADGAGDVFLGLADSYSQSTSDGRRLWSFRIRPGSFFSDGNLVTAEDVVYSLDRCRRAGSLNQILAVRKKSPQRPAQHGQYWIEVEEGLDSSVPAGRLLANLTSCAIVERSSAEVFGVDLGFGSNLVSSAPYYIAGINSNNEYLLKGARESRIARGRSVIIRGFRDPQHGLTALRTGTIDALFTEDGQVLEKAAKDETLLLGKCSVYMVVRRKGLELPCKPRVDLARVGYKE